MQTLSKLPKNIYLLCLSQIIGMSAVAMVVLTGGIIGADMAPSPTLATLPVTLMIVGVAFATIPAVMLMKKFGRKKGFILSSLTAVLATLLAAFAIAQNNFYLFCFATLILGTNGAFLHQYRFAALESVPQHMESRAVSFVLLAGILSGFVGPELAKRTKDLFGLPDYAGSFVSLALIFCVSAFLLALLKDIKLHEESHKEERPLRLIIKQPLYMIAVLAATLGYGVMFFIMTATPVHLHTLSHYSLEHTAFVIQSHIIAMFLPSLITGTLIERFGILKILVSGLVSFCAAVLFAINASVLSGYWIALVLLGIGWNFLFIGSTVLLSKSYHQSERFKAQGVNDFIVVVSQMLVSFLAGSLLFNIGWINLNLLVLPFIAAAFVLILTKRNLFVSSPKKE